MCVYSTHQLLTGTVDMANTVSHAEGNQGMAVVVIAGERGASCGRKRLALARGRVDHGPTIVALRTIGCGCQHHQTMVGLIDCCC